MSQKQKISEPRHEHPLPRVRSFSSYLVRGAALVLVLSVVGLVVNIALGGDSGVSALCEVGEIFSLLCLVIGLLSWRVAKKNIPRILMDRRTIHWTYTQEEWQRFATLAWRRSLSSMLVGTGIIWVILLFVFLGSFENFLLALALSAGLAVLVDLVFILVTTLDFQWRRHRTTADVYINRAGIILNGWYHPMGGWMSSLNRITYKAGDPSVLSFSLGSGRGRHVLTVPVPHGREGEAEQVTWSLGH